MRRLLALLAAAAVLLLTPFSASLAETAADMRLEAYTGTVTVTDAGGRPLSLQDGMRLFDGYGMNTGARSYAWVSLDRTKALKLDALSSAKISKTGRKLEIDLLSGRLLCDVSAPLDDGESLEIRTSTTVTGIRGTVLVVKVIDEHTVVIYVLEGKVTVTETDPETGNTRMITVAAGQQATSTARIASGGGEGNDVTLAFFTADEVDDFVRDEIDRDPDFVEQLRGTDSAEVQKLLDEIGADPSAEDPGPRYVNIIITTTDDPSEDIPSEFLDALAGNTHLNLTVLEVEDFSPGQDVTVEGTQTVNLDESGMDMQTNELNNAGTINVYGGLIIDGVLVNTGVINIYGLTRALYLNNTGKINIFEGGTLVIQGEEDSPDRSGMLSMSGALDIETMAPASAGSPGDALASPPGSLYSDSNVVNGGTITNNGTLTNTGDIENNGIITNGHSLVNNGSGTITNTGFIDNTDDGTLTNAGSIENNGMGMINNAGTVNNGGTITNEFLINNAGTIANTEAGSITNAGTITNTNAGSITNAGTFTNTEDGGIENAGAIENSNALINHLYIENGGTIVNTEAGSITNNGVIINTDGGSIENNGTITGDGDIVEDEGP